MKPHKERSITYSFSIPLQQHALSDKAVIKPFIPMKVINEECLVTTFQNGYFETSSFEDATRQMRQVFTD